MTCDVVLTMRSSFSRLLLADAPLDVFVAWNEGTTGRAGVSGWEEEEGVGHAPSAGGTTEDTDMGPTGVM